MRVILPQFIGVLFSILFTFFAPIQLYAQGQTCEEILVEANNMYSRGAFDDTIRLLDQCIANENLSEAQRKIAFRLKGLSFIGKGLEVDARESIRRLIQLVPNYEPDPVMDPPNFVQLITEVKKEIDAELNAATPPAEIQTPVTQASPALESPSPAPARVTSNNSTRKKKGKTKWIIGGLGVAAAGGLVAVLASGGKDAAGSTIAEPPALP